MAEKKSGFYWYQPWKVYNAFRYPKESYYSPWTRWEAFTWSITRSWDKFPLSSWYKMGKEMERLEIELGFKKEIDRIYKTWWR